MHQLAYEFVARHATADPVSVLDVGGRNVNGTVRDLFPKASWTAVDLRDGPGVDVVADIMQYLPPERVDIVVCCEVLEHAPRWRDILQRCCQFLRPGGKLIVTCAGPARAPHSAIDGRHELIGGEYYQNISASDIYTCLEQHGFENIQVDIGDGLQDTYATAIWPGYRLITDAIPWPLLESVRATWPSDKWSGWHRYQGANGDKYGLKHAALLPWSAELALASLIHSLSPYLPRGCFWDLDMHGAGLHMIPAGGFLGRHVDAEQHPLESWRRTHSAVLFLDRCEGGDLVLGDSLAIRPEPNTAVIFETHRLWHDVLRSTSVRRTLALFAWEQSASIGATCATFSGD